MGTREGGYAVGRLRREQIVTAATELFSRVGYRHATVLELAQAAGISRTGLLHHFSSKEALLEAVLQRRDVEDTARLAPAQTDETGLTALAALVDLARYNASRPQLVALFAVLSAEASAPDHPAHDYFVQRYRRTVEGARRSLCRAERAGLLAAGVDPSRQARALVALMDGLQVQWLLSPDDVDMAEEVRQQVQQLLTVPLPGSD
ncbi:MAG: TetR/AcrR family transcriptional regulator [Micropruina sp.]|uniref:TetR/AcrR family transcriptional regulator n=1 Tax=Micropruina sp. TaxID=2737536 RepID=UPI0039E6B464